MLNFIGRNVFLVGAFGFLVYSLFLVITGESSPEYHKAAAMFGGAVLLVVMHFMWGGADFGWVVQYWKIIYLVGSVVVLIVTCLHTWWGREPILYSLLSTILAVLIATGTLQKIFWFGYSVQVTIVAWILGLLALLLPKLISQGAAGELFEFGAVAYSVALFVAIPVALWHWLKKN